MKKIIRSNRSTPKRPRRANRMRRRMRIAGKGDTSSG